MKKPRVTRYNLDKVYFMKEYNKTVSYGNQNINLQGVKEQLQELEQAKKIYVDKVKNLVDPEKDTEQTKYQKYEKWSIIERSIKYLEIPLLIAYFICPMLFELLPIAFHFSFIFSLTNALLPLVAVFVGPIAFVVAKIMRGRYALQYNQYIVAIRDSVNSLGSNFTKTSLKHYDEIDILYLGSLDPAHREVILLRRQQETHNQEILRLEKERQESEKQHLIEQQKTRQATEELLKIEQERERRYRGW